jgi:hypothetical protein
MTTEHAAEIIKQLQAIRFILMVIMCVACSFYGKMISKILYQFHDLLPEWMNRDVKSFFKK